jgi:hypothetical protein
MLDKAAVSAGDKVSLTARVMRSADWTGAIQLQGFALPPNATVNLVNVAQDAAEAKVELTMPANVKPGVYSFVINGAGQASRDYLRPKVPNQPRGANMRVVYPSNAVTITVVPAK